MSGEAEAEVTRFLLQMLQEAVKEHTNLKGGAKHEFQKLNEELGLLEAFLKDTDKMSEKSELFREKERQIRELVYDVEDTIQTYMAKKAVAKTKLVTRFIDNFSTSMEQQVKSLRLQSVTPIVKEITMKYGNIHLNEGPSTSSDIPRAEGIMDQLSNQDEVVDFQDEATIIEYLQEEKEELDVIVVTGMPGLGKTTFARKIFEHETIVREFELRSWNRVSQRFNIRDVLLNILKNFTPRGTSSPSEEELIPTVRACLTDKKFLLVMDDVWTVEDWNVIRGILPTNNGKGKVLVTTREIDVATQANISRRAHQLNELEANESLKLLKIKVFDNHEKCPPELEVVVQKIANKCNGVPLIILLIGGILKEVFALTQSPPAVNDEWERVLGNVDDKLKEDKKNLISNALELSYKRLARDLRLCFLYMGLFPENHEIPASTLTKLWIAEGFIQRKDGQSIEETAKEIMNNLMNMNLLMAAKKNLDQVKTCRVHDMIRAFCITKAREQNIFRVIKASNEGVLEPPIFEVQQFRRLCLHSNPSIFLSASPNGPGVRSFLCFFNEPSPLNSTHISKILDAFNLLRVLNCKSIKFGVFPEVSRLILLKHISLCIDNLNVLPKKISKLLNLQTLIVDTKSHSITVKANIWKMIQLRRFKTKASISLDGKNGKGKPCENFQTVSRLSPNSCNATLSERAPNLKTLGIRGKLAKLFDTFSMEKFSQLEKLKLVNDLVNEAAASSNPLFGRPQPNRVPTNLNRLTLSDNPLCLTQQNRFPPNLKRLSLSETHLKWADHMQILAGITTLNVLKLKDNAFTGKFWQVEGVVFPELQFLLIENTDLEDWNASTTNFPNLRWLVIKSCKQLKAIPESLASLNHLEKLEIERVKRSVADSASTIESIKKQAEPNQQSILGVPFKLTIGPGCTLL